MIVRRDSPTDHALAEYNNKSKILKISPVVRVIGAPNTEGVAQVQYFQAGSLADKSRGYYEGEPITVNIVKKVDLINVKDLLSINQIYAPIDEKTAAGYVNTVAIQTQESLCPIFRKDSEAEEKSYAELLPHCDACLSSALVKEGVGSSESEVQVKDLSHYASTVTKDLMKKLTEPFSTNDIKMYKLQCSGFHYATCGSFFVVVTSGDTLNHPLKFYILRTIYEEQLQTTLLQNNGIPTSPDVYKAIRWDQVPLYNEMLKKVKDQSLGCKIEITEGYLRGLIEFLLTKGYTVSSVKPTTSQSNLFLSNLRPEEKTINKNTPILNSDLDTINFEEGDMLYKTLHNIAMGGKPGGDTIATATTTKTNPLF